MAMSAASLGAWRLLLCVLTAAAVLLLGPQPDTLRHGLALFVLVGGLWMTQALPLPVTALLVPLLAVLAGLADVRQALAPFAHPIIFLFLGGFALAAALQHHGMDRALAQQALRAARGRLWLAVLLLFALAALLSMWISNTATAAMMLPLALGLLRSLPGGPPGSGSAEQRSHLAGATPAETAQAAGAAPPAASGTREQAFVLLGLAYSCSIGGIATLVGSPPNAIAAAQAGIGFAQWLGIAGPVALLLWPLTLGVLALLLRPRLGGRVALSPVQGSAPGDTAAGSGFVWTRGRVLTLAVFAATALGWVFAVPLGRVLGISAEMETVISLAAIATLAVLGLLPWPTLEQRAQWGVLLLFGGGLALSAVMGSSGASRWLADQLVLGMAGAAMWALVLGVVVFVVLLTELVSNTASAALLVPIFLGVGSSLGLPPVLLASAIAIAASCAFMLPVATPPNAIVFGTGLLPQSTMMRCGLVLNGVCAVVITLLVLRGA
jgi:solute carrier family 13 (sodium-dependent dicarboxylate transporter), member 2/3/5